MKPSRGCVSARGRKPNSVCSPVERRERMPVSSEEARAGIEPRHEDVLTSVSVPRDEVVGERRERDDATVSADPGDEAVAVRFRAVSRDAHTSRPPGNEVMDEDVGHPVQVALDEVRARAT